MPLLHIRCNQEIDPARSLATLKLFSKQVANLLGKPESYVMTTLDAGVPMTFAGSDAPAAYLRLKSLGLTTDQTHDLSAGLCELLEQQLEIPAERVYIEFSAPERAMWGWNGGTF